MVVFVGSDSCGADCVARDAHTLGGARAPPVRRLKRVGAAIRERTAMVDAWRGVRAWRGGAGTARLESESAAELPGGSDRGSHWARVVNSGGR